MIGDVLPLDIPALHLHGMEGQDHMAVITLPREGTTRGMQYYFLFVVCLLKVF